MIPGLNLRHLGLIGLSSTRNAIRGGAGIIYLVLVLYLGLFVASQIVSPVEMQVNPERSQDLRASYARVIDNYKFGFRPVLLSMLGADAREGKEDEEEHREAIEEWYAYLVEDRPALLSIIFLFLNILTPMLVVLGSFNQISGDVASRGIRFLLPRTERINLYLGRFLGTAIYAAAALWVLVGIIVLYLGFKMPAYTWGELLAWGVWGMVALSLIALPYIAFCSWVSASLNSSLASIAICYVATLAMPLLALVMRSSMGIGPMEYLGYVQYITPWGYQDNLFSRGPVDVGTGMAACLVFTVVFLVFGARRFARRDL